MSKQVACVIAGTGAVFIIDGTTYNVGNNHPKFKECVNAYRSGNYELLGELIDISTTIKQYGRGLLTVKEGAVYYDGHQLRGSIVKRILDLISIESETLESLVLFLDNLYANTSNRAIEELYTFLEVSKLPITVDGYFLAYKKVRNDYKDIHSGTFDNSVGQVLQMPRHLVDDNPNNTCSRGLHVAAYSYMGNFGNNSTDKVVICKINPKDVVSVPVDYNSTKMRVCEYQVIADITGQGDVLKDVKIN